MRIFSQNLSNYDLPLPKDCIFRINLAWVNGLEELKSILLKHVSHQIFLDLPINRTKPPHNKYSIEELIPIIKEFSNIRYFAISNVEKKDDVIKFKTILPSSVNIVPKIESKTGIDNIEEITNELTSKIIMLDHDDLFSSLIKLNEDPITFKTYISILSDFCNKNNVILLRTIGVIFSDEETKISNYVR
ncbi:hypothetical protein [Nitrosarchaeum sp.]|uniref:hypothetical protein n=1 Tax=Nitrosarchaeum sp. TaxID=2026886 RepID=UPI00247B8AC8|nr:hypothetical protein [Nitrosarchaeum sp.]MCV0411908.1 hypothetical protein [Nitrosarchaeum sp.]